MPIPEPSKGQSKSNYMSECMSFLKDEGKPHEQAVAICLNKWGDKMEESKILERINLLVGEVTKTAPEEEKYLTKKERKKHPYALKVTMIKKRKAEEKKKKGVNEATIEFYTHAQKKPSDTLEAKDVPSLLRSIGQGVKKISLESEGNRQALNKALKAGKTVYVSFNPFHEQMSGVKQLLWHTNKDKFVKIYKNLVAEV